MKTPLIKYSLFQARKKFNPVLLFEKDPNLTYDKFVSYLNSKQVDSPGEEYFNRVKDHFVSLIQEKIKPVEEETLNLNKVEGTSKNINVDNTKISVSRKKSRSKNRKKAEDEKENISKETSLKRDVSD